MTLIVNDVVEEVVKDDMAHGTQAFREEWQTGRPCMYKDSLVFVRANLTPPNLDSPTRSHMCQMRTCLSCC